MQSMSYGTRREVLSLRALAFATLAKVSPGPRYAYLGSKPEEIASTAARFRHARAALRSGCRFMRDPFNRSWSSPSIEVANFQRKLHWYLDVAINRKAGLPDGALALDRRWMVDDVLTAAERIRRDDPELPVSTGHFTPPMKRALDKILKARKRRLHGLS